MHGLTGFEPKTIIVIGILALREVICWPEVSKAGIVESMLVFPLLVPSSISEDTRGKHWFMTKKVFMKHLLLHLLY